jgi:hypothetical protein
VGILLRLTINTGQGSSIFRENYFSFLGQEIWNTPNTTSTTPAM